MEDDHLHLSVFFILSVMFAVAIGNVLVRTLALHGSQSKYAPVRAAAKGATYLWG